MKLPVRYTSIPANKRYLVREEYTKKQNSLCYYCKQSLYEQPSKEVLNLPINEALFPQGFFNYPIHLHHSRTTGMTVGAVHSYCNAVLWQYKGE